MENKHIELTDAEVEIVNQVTEAQKQLQAQINTVLAVSFAARNIKNAQVTSVDGNKIFYSVGGETRAAEELVNADGTQSATSLTEAELHANCDPDRLKND